MQFFIPKTETVFKEEIKKSQFITYIRHTEGMEQAKAFWAGIRALHPNARHHCWASIAGAQMTHNNTVFPMMVSLQVHRENRC